VIITRARKLANKHDDFDPSRREFLKLALSGAVGAATAYLAQKLTPIVHAETIQPYIRSRAVTSEKTLRRPHCLVFLEDDGKTAVAMDWKGKEEFRSTDHAKVLEEAPKIHPRVVIDAPLTLEKPVKFSGYDRLEIIGTPRAKIYYKALAIKSYIEATNWWGTGSSYIVVFCFSDVKHVLVKGLYFEMADWDDWLAAGKPSGSVILARSVNGKPVEFIEIRRCIIYKHLLNALTFTRYATSDPLPKVIIIDRCHIYQPSDIVYGNAVGAIAQDIYILRNYFEGHGVTLALGDIVNAVIEDNIIERTDDTSIQVGPPSYFEPKFIIIKRNTIRNPSVSSAGIIHVLGSSTFNVNLVIVEENKCYGDPSTSIWGPPIVIGDYVRNVVIVKNMLEYAGGIRVQWPNHEKTLISYNQILNVKSTDYTIRVEGGIAFIENNIVDLTQPIHFWITYAVIRNNIGFEVGKYIYTSDAVPIGYNDTYGNPCGWTSQKNRFGLAWTPTKLYVCGCPIRFIKIDVSGINTTVGEVITVKLVATKADGSQNTLEKSFNSDTTYYLTDEELLQLLQGDYPVTAIEVYAKTNQGSTTASVYVTVGVD